MPPVPLLAPAEVVRTSEPLGWTAAKRRGGYMILTKPGSLATLSVPDHKEVTRGTLRSLIARAGLTTLQFLSAVDR